MPRDGTLRARINWDFVEKQLCVLPGSKPPNVTLCPSHFGAAAPCSLSQTEHVAGQTPGLGPHPPAASHLPAPPTPPWAGGASPQPLVQAGPSPAALPGGGPAPAGNGRTEGRGARTGGAREAEGGAEGPLRPWPPRW